MTAVWPIASLTLASMAAALRMPTVAAIAKELLDRGVGKPNQSIDLNQTHSFSEDFEAFIRRLNDKSDTQAQRIQDDAAAQVITVDFEALEKG
jgi:hypothetical protein